MHNPLTKRNLFLPLKKGYVSVDIESQGYLRNCPIEISAVRYSRHGERLDAYTTYVRPRTRHISKHVVALTGITYDMVKNAPRPAQVITKFVDFIGKLPIIGHAVIENDLPILNYYSKITLKRELHNPVIDTLYLAKALYPDVGHWGLQALAENFGIDGRVYHRAEADCETTSRLYWCLMRKYMSMSKKERSAALLSLAHGNAKKTEETHHIDYSLLPPYDPERFGGHKSAVLRLWHWGGETRLRLETCDKMPENAIKLADAMPQCGWYLCDRILLAENVTPKALEHLAAILTSSGYGIYRDANR